MVAVLTFWSNHRRKVARMNVTRLRTVLLYCLPGSLQFLQASAAVAELVRPGRRSAPVRLNPPLRLGSFRRRDVYPPLAGSQARASPDRTLTPRPFYPSCVGPKLTTRPVFLRSVMCARARLLAKTWTGPILRNGRTGPESFMSARG